MFQFLIPAAAALIGSSMSSRAAKSAAQTSAQSADRATELQQRMYEESVARQQPFLQTGTEFFNRLAAVQRGGPEAQNFLQMDPGYQPNRCRPARPTRSLNWSAKCLRPAGSSLQSPARQAPSTSALPGAR